jgi:hypothetical protein
VDFFENYAILAMQSDNITFCASKLLKGTSGFNFKKTNFSPGGANIQKTAEILFKYK